MALTDSLDAATQQVLALLQQLKLSNTRVIQAQDTGPADNVTLAPTPAITAYGPDLLVLADIAFPNQTPTPRMTISGLSSVPVTASDGTAARLGAVAGKCLFGFTSLPAGGYAARLLIAIPEAQYGPGEGIAINNGAIALNVPALAEEDVIGATDLFPFFQSQAEGGQGGGHHRRTTFSAFASAVLALAPPPAVKGPEDFAGVALPANIPIPNATETTIPFTGLACAFAIGTSAGLQFTKAGLYTLDFQVSVQVNTVVNSAGGSAQEARYYTNVWAYHQGLEVYVGSQAGSGENYVGSSTYSGSISRYFNEGDVFSLAASGTGDYYESGGVAIVAPSNVNLTLID